MLLGRGGRHRWTSFMDMRQRQAAILILLQVGLLLHACIPVNGHGFMYKPAARQFQAYNPIEKYYEATGNNGGGVLRTKQGDWREGGGKHTLCGDPDGGNDWMTPRAIQATYAYGATIETEVLIWNHHAGRYGFNVCPKGATQQSQCQPLMRADGKSRWWYLPLPPNDPKLENLWKVYGPNLQVGSDTDGAFSWFRVPERADGMNQFKGTPVLQTKWKLPSDMKFDCTNGCILQWYWLTGNSCWPPCDVADPMHPNCARRCDKPNCFCTDEGAAYPEEFWNCADIKILPNAAFQASRRRPGVSRPGVSKPTPKAPAKKGPVKKTPTPKGL